jgi:hypothetical protein
MGPDMEDKQMTQNAAGYAFPHTKTGESHRLDLSWDLDERDLTAG